MLFSPERSTGGARGEEARNPNSSILKGNIFFRQFFLLTLGAELGIFQRVGVRRYQIPKTSQEFEVQKAELWFPVSRLSPGPRIGDRTKRIISHSIFRKTRLAETEVR